MASPTSIWSSSTRQPPAVYQSLGERAGRGRAAGLGGLMATFVRQRGLLGRDHRRRSRRSSAPRRRRRARSRCPRLVAVVVYGHQPSASTQNMPAASAVVHRAQGSRARAAGADGRRPRRGAARAHAAPRSAATSSPAAKACTRSSSWSRRCASGTPDFAKRARPVVRATAPARSAARPAPLVTDLDDEMPASPGTCCRCSATAPTTGTASASRARSRTPRSTPRSAARTTAPSAASRRRSRAARASPGYKDSANSYRFWSPTRVVDEIDAAGRTLRRAQHQDRRRDVRAERAPRARHLRRHHRARLRPQHLGLRARRHREGRHAREAEARRVSTGWRSASRPPASACAPTWTRASTGRAGLPHAREGARRRHQRDRQLHLRPARGRPRDDAGRRSTWRSS